MGATLFDLTPDNFTHKLKEKHEMDMLFKAVSNLSKILAPSVIFVDGGHKPWVKSKPEELEKSNAKRFAPILTKLIKGIKRGDQVCLKK